ncbi:FAD binding domain-containing protein [Rhodopseudomonas palustris]|uniref:Carbon monoxide dehydrogenase n=1 Tax=Rhodopseudomonas palustris TaxID=1076 RepID=A0A418V0N4_RHOPL|nr:FAD binding domain-containing protein [Rhodopseudomonas palustris]RJF69388.1 carbon monoxide dehydrogenase [Rhodopseudomonas palustris]
MKPISFDFIRANTLAEAAQALADHDGDARVLAGGQSLVPMLNMRLVRPTAVVDISRIAELTTIDISPSVISIGAMVTHAQIERSAHTGATFDLLRQVAGGIAYRGVRNRGTIGGSVAHCDPAADWLTCLRALGAELHLVGAQSTRRLPIADFLLGSFTTALEPGELLARIDVPVLGPAMRFGYYKHNRKVGEFAEAIGCVVSDAASGHRRIVAGALSAPPVELYPGDWPASFSIEGLRQAVRDAAPGVEGQHVHFHAAAILRALKIGCLA